jgi:hypothetical protein
MGTKAERCRLQPTTLIGHLTLYGRALLLLCINEFLLVLLAAGPTDQKWTFARSKEHPSSSPLSFSLSLFQFKPEAQKGIKKGNIGPSVCLDRRRRTVS